MFIELTPEQRQLQAELRQYFSNLISSDEMKAMEQDRHNAAYRAVIRRMGQDGKLGVGWPKEFGGHGFGPIEQSIFVNEAHRADVPLPAVTLQTVGPTLQRFGSEMQKKKFLPAILAGEVHFAIGYTEPEAGTDLAALRTTAVRQGDEYIVNGQKVFTTGAHDADYIWLACRTDPEAVKHKGISILIVDTKDPGYSWTPIILSDGAHHTNATYYNDVRVPADMLVGEENGGWRLITTQLNNERVMVVLEVRIHGHHLRPVLLTLLGRRVARPQRQHLGLDLHGDFGIGLQVEVPQRVFVAADAGGAQNDAVALAQVEQRAHPALAGSASGGGQQRDGTLLHRAAEFSVGAPVDPRIGASQPLQEKRHPRRIQGAWLFHLSP